MSAGVAQCFVQSPRMWRAVEHPSEELARVAAGAGMPLFVHASYLLNLASGDSALWERSIESLAGQYETACRAGAAGVVLHPGSHKGSSEAAGTARAAAGIARALAKAKEKLGGEGKSALLLENSAGGGSSLCAGLEGLAALATACGKEHEIGVCLDTQHLWAAGWDFSTEEAVESLLDRFDDLIGLARLRLLHLNDSKVPLGAGRDRHENLGEGEIGRHALSLLCGHPRLAEVPMVLEVPGAQGAGPTKADIEVAVAIIEEGRRSWASGGTSR